jgi:type IV pilus assembly protein PilX
MMCISRYHLKTTRESLRARSLVLAQSRNQQGVVLIISLIMLVIMTLIGLAGVRLISSEERMVSYSYDRALSFQAAESALREVEGKIDNAGRPEPAFGAGCNSTGASPYTIMVCATATLATPRWGDSTFTSWTNAAQVGTGTLAVTPQYFVEYLGSSFPCEITSTTSSNCLRYRITARAQQPSSERSQVVLQSIYATYKP